MSTPPPTPPTTPPAWGQDAEVTQAEDAEHEEIAAVTAAVDPALAHRLAYGHWVSHLLGQSGLTKGELCQKTGLKRQTITNVQKGRHLVSGSTHKALYHAFGATEKVSSADLHELQRRFDVMHLQDGERGQAASRGAAESAESVQPTQTHALATSEALSETRALEPQSETALTAEGEAAIDDAQVQLLDHESGSVPAVAPTPVEQPSEEGEESAPEATPSQTSALHVAENADNGQTQVSGSTEDLAGEVAGSQESAGQSLLEGISTEGEKVPDVVPSAPVVLPSQTSADQGADQDLQPGEELLPDAGITPHGTPHITPHVSPSHTSVLESQEQDEEETPPPPAPHLTHPTATLPPAVRVPPVPPMRPIPVPVYRVPLPPRARRRTPLLIGALSLLLLIAVIVVAFSQLPRLVGPGAPSSQSSPISGWLVLLLAESGGSDQVVSYNPANGQIHPWQLPLDQLAERQAGTQGPSVQAIAGLAIDPAHRTFAFSLLLSDGTHVVGDANLQREAGGWLDADLSVTQVLGTCQGPCGSLAFSPDGRWVLAADSGGIVAYDTNQIEQVDLRHIAPPNFDANPACSPDGDVLLHDEKLGTLRYLVLVHTAGCVHLDLTQSLVEYVGAGGMQLSQGAWSPDGHFIAYTRRARETSRGQVYVVPTTTVLAEPTNDATAQVVSGSDCDDPLWASPMQQGSAVLLYRCLSPQPHLEAATFERGSLTPAAHSTLPASGDLADKLMTWAWMGD